MPLLLCCAFALCLPLQQTVPVASVWEDLTLDNGLRVALVEAPEATSQVVFSILPWGLLDDQAGQAQLSHLAEHLLVHSADPTATRPLVDGVLRNGETMALSMRLETFSDLDSWREGLARHARWLDPAGADGELLERILPRELSAIDAELVNTTAGGVTHKWALAAWNQVVRQGASKVAVRSGLGKVSWDALWGTLRRRVHAGPGVQIVSVGPIDLELQKQAMKELLGSLPGRPWKPAPATLSPARISAPGERQATWDLDRIQSMIWYPMPDERALDRVAADALSAVINSRLQQRGSLLSKDVHAFSSADLITAEGRWLLISASLPPDADVPAMNQVLDEVLSGLDQLPESSLVIEEMVRQLSTWPDFATLRREAAGQPGLRWIEASQALFMIYAQLNMGLNREELLRAYGHLDRAVLEELARDWVVPEKRSRLILRPGS